LQAVGADRSRDGPYLVSKLGHSRNRYLELGHSQHDVQDSRFLQLHNSRQYGRYPLYNLRTESPSVSPYLSWRVSEPASHGVNNNMARKKQQKFGQIPEPFEDGRLSPSVNLYNASRLPRHDTHDRDDSDYVLDFTTPRDAGTSQRIQTPTPLPFQASVNSRKPNRTLKQPVALRRSAVPNTPKERMGRLQPLDRGQLTAFSNHQQHQSNTFDLSPTTKSFTKSGEPKMAAASSMATASEELPVIGTRSRQGSLFPEEDSQHHYGNTADARTRKDVSKLTKPNHH
ncbi:unnamed protein product, partial [Candidula unifasciata]